MTIQAVQHIRRMRGGAQSHLMRCSDGNFYVVKFQNNPQHTRVLANDWLGTCFAALVGLSVPTPAIVEVHPWLIEHTPELRFELGGKQVMPLAGLCFGSRYVVPQDEGVVHDYLPEGSMSCVSAIKTSSPAFSPSTNGPATPMAGRSRFGRGCGNAS